MNAKSSPQKSAVTALTEFLAAYPDLLELRWGIAPGGQLSGSAFDIAEFVPAVQAYAAAFGEEPRFGSFTSAEDGSVHPSASMYPVWRDVQFYITLGGPAVEADLGALLEQRHQTEDAAEPPAAYRDDALVSLPVAAWAARVSA